MTLSQGDWQCRLGFPLASHYTQVPLSGVGWILAPDLQLFSLTLQRGLDHIRIIRVYFEFATFDQLQRESHKWKPGCGCCPLVSTVVLTHWAGLGNSGLSNYSSLLKVPLKIESNLFLGASKTNYKTPSCLLEHEASAPPIMIGNKSNDKNRSPPGQTEASHSRSPL